MKPQNANCKAACQCVQCHDIVTNTVSSLLNENGPEGPGAARPLDCPKSITFLSFLPSIGVVFNSIRGQARSRISRDVRFCSSACSVACSVCGVQRVELGSQSKSLEYVCQRLEPRKRMGQEDGRKFRRGMDYRRLNVCWR